VESTPPPAVAAAQPRREAAPQRERAARHISPKKAAATLPAAGGARTARGLSNAKLIRNALSHVCLAGVIMEPQRLKALAALDKHKGASFVILFNSSNALTFRGLYVLEGGGLAPGETAVRKICGAGPAFAK
jgi:hypothetical protein